MSSTFLYTYCDDTPIDLQERKYLKAPDDVLADRIGAPPLIPVFQRGIDLELPDSDLLKALHYYVGMRFPQKKQLFDESSLLAMGFILEDWMDELFNDETFKLFVKQRRKKQKRSKHKDVVVGMGVEEQDKHEATEEAGLDQDNQDHTQE